MEIFFPESRDLHQALIGDDELLAQLAGLTLISFILSCPFYLSLPVYGFALLVGLSATSTPVHLAALFFALSLPLHHTLVTERRRGIAIPYDATSPDDVTSPDLSLSLVDALRRLDLTARLTLAVTLLAGLLAAWLAPASLLHFVFLVIALALGAHYARLARSIIRLTRLVRRS